MALERRVLLLNLEQELSPRRALNELPLCLQELFTGAFGDANTTFHRMHTLFGNPVGQLVLIAVISLTFWHAFHRILHSLHDLGVRQGLAALKILCYGLAGLGSVAALVAALSVG